jgi:hypothetical protein
MTQINVWVLILIIFGFSGICILLNLLLKTLRNECNGQNSQPDLPIEVPRVTFLVQGEPATNVSRNAIDIVPYRNNTIQNPIEIDGAYIRVAEIQVGEKEIHPASYAFMV